MKKIKGISEQRALEMRICWMDGYYKGVKDGSATLKTLVYFMKEIQNKPMQKRIIKMAEEMRKELNTKEKR